MNAPKTKIAIISHALGGGGAERFAGLLGFMLEDLGYEIHNVILTEKSEYAYTGSLLNLGLLGKREPFWKRKLTKATALRKYLSEHAIETIIDNRPRNFQLSEWVTRQIYSERKVFYMIHSHNLYNYLPKSVFLAKWLYGKSEKLVCVSHAIETKVKSIYGFENTVTIHNPVNLHESAAESGIALPEKFILYFGRFVEQTKNFTLMLESYSQSQIYKEGFQLLLMGEGPDEKRIKAEIAKHQLEQYVSIIPYQKNPFEVVKKARYVVLSSRFEGFPMSVVEALANGTPVVAVDCESGPRELIQNQYNGLLVENNNPTALADAMKQLALDVNLYQTCKANATGSVLHLSPAAIAKKWDAILNRPI